MIRAVIFDFGGVLMRTADPAGRREWEARLGLEPGQLAQVVHGSDLWIEAQSGRLTPDAYWRGVAERLGIDEAELPALQADYFRDDHLDWNLVALIKALRGAGYRVGLLSNDLATLEAKLSALGIDDMFDAVVISAQVGVMKPDASAFRMVAERLGFSVAECAFIDDNTANVDGARGVGMQAILYTEGMDVRAALQPILNQDTTRALIFDYGNVLDVPEDWDTWLARREALAEPLGLTGEGLGAQVFQSEAWHQVKRGLISYETYLDEIFRPLGIEESEEQRAMINAFFAGRDRIHPEMLALLHELRPRYRLALLSNAYQLDMARWLAEERNLDGIFEVVISSAAVGMAKPDAEIYQYALEQLGIRPGEALFIDDLARNTVVAESLGIPCIVFESPAQLRRDLTRRGILEARARE